MNSRLKKYGLFLATLWLALAHRPSGGLNARGRSSNGERAASTRTGRSSRATAPGLRRAARIGTRPTIW